MSTKNNRIEIRSSDEEKKKFEETAALANMGLSEFFRFAAQLYAETLHKKFHKNLKITLTKEEGLRFLDALDNPPKPNERLKRAMQIYDYKKDTTSHNFN